MIDYYTLHPLARRIYPLVFTLLVQARSAFIAIAKECRSGLIYSLKAQRLYILTTLIFFISAPSDEFASLLVSSYDENLFRNNTDSSTLDIDLESNAFKYGVLGSGAVHSVVVTKPCLEIIEILTSSSHTNSAMEAWSSCKSFFRSWCSTISAQCTECASCSVIACEEWVTRNKTDFPALDVESDWYWFKNGFLSKAYLEIREIPTFNFFTNSAMDIWGFCKSFSRSWCSSYDENVFIDISDSSALDVDLTSYKLKNAVLGPGMVHAVVVTKASLEISEILTSSSPTNSAMEAWRFSKSFLRSWCDTISAGCIKCASSPVIAFEERVTRNIMDVSALDVEYDWYWFKNRFVSKAYLEIREIPTSSSSTNSAMEAWGFCKSFSRSWRSTISARCVECTFSLVVACEERVTRNITDVSALDVKSDCYWFSNGFLGSFMENSRHGITANCSYVHAVVISGAWLEIIEIPSSTSSTLISPAMKAWGICKSFLCQRSFCFMLNLIATWDCLSYVICEPKYTFVSLLSFGMMFALTSYLVVLTLKLNRKRVHPRSNSCI